MFEQLSDIEILIVSGEEAEIEDETVQHSEKFVGRRFIEKTSNCSIKKVGSSSTWRKQMMESTLLKVKNFECSFYIF